MLSTRIPLHFRQAFRCSRRSKKSFDGWHKGCSRAGSSLVDGRIAWNHYLKAFIEELMTSEAKREAANGEPVLVVDSKGSDEPIIFGG